LLTAIDFCTEELDKGRAPYISFWRCFAYSQEGFLIEAICDIEPLQDLSLLSRLIGTTGAKTLLICSLLLVIANRKYSNLRIRKLQSNRIFVKKIATNLSEKYKNRFEFFHKKFSEIKSVIKALKNKKLVVLYLI
jgi:hypothetical protein